MSVLDPLTDEQREIRELVRTLAHERIGPRAAEIDATAEFPWDVVELYRENDLFGIMYDEQYGGIGASALMTLVTIEELSKVCATSGLIIAVQELGGLPIMIAGTDEQKRRLIAASPDCLVELDLDGTLLFISPHGSELLEVEDGAEMLGRSWSDLWPAHSQHVLLEALRISMIFNFTGVMIAEMYASRTGIGHLISNWGENFQLPQLFAGVILLAVVAIAFNETVRTLERRVSAWRT